MQRVCPCQATRTRWPCHGTRGSRPRRRVCAPSKGRKAPGTHLQDLVHEKAACTPIRGLPSLLPAPGDEWRLGQKFRAETKVTSFRCANPIPWHRQFTDDPAIRRADGRKGQRDPKHGSPRHSPSGENGRCAHGPLARPRHHHLTCAASVPIPADAAEGARVPGRRLARTPRPRPRPSPPLFPLRCPTSRSSRRAPEPASRGRRHTPAPEKAEPASGRGRRGRGAQEEPEAAHPQTPSNSLKSQTK